jgi:hypothetical protein
MGSGGVNDVLILSGILTVLIVMGFLMPIFSGELNVPDFTNVDQQLNITTTKTPPTFATDTTDVYKSDSWFPGTSTFDILKSLAQSLFWFYNFGTGTFAMIFMLFHFMIRVIAGVIIYRLIRSGSG